MKTIKNDTILQIGNSIVNCYLVEEQDSMTLIDTGMGSFAKEIIRQAQILQKPIRCILLTHLHWDHTAGLSKLISLLPDGFKLLYIPKNTERVGSLQAIATPGHTDDSFSFLDTRNHYLIAGDALQTAGGIAVAGHLRLRFPLPALATKDKKEAVRSAQKLLVLSPALLAVGHGAMLENPKAAMGKAILEAQRALK